MAKAYRMTPRRRAALRKAQLASARKRRRNKVIRRTAIGVGVLGVAGGAAYGRHKLSGSKLTVSKHGPVSMTGRLTGSHGRTFHTGHVTGKPPRTGTVRVYNERAGRTQIQHTYGKAPKLGRDFMYSGRKQGPLGSHRTVTYEHRRLKKDVLGKAIRGAPKAVVRDRPASARQRKKMSAFNVVPQTTAGQEHGQFARAAMKFRHTNAPHAYVRTIEHGEAMRRTRNYVDSLKPKKRTVRRQRQAMGYFAAQPRYPATGTSIRRGRKQSRVQRKKTK